VSAKIGNEDFDTGFHVTSPDPWVLPQIMNKMVKRGMKYAVVEATSHGLDQNRFFGLHFKISVLTNITHEHLDYHHNYEQYAKAKAILFNNSDVCILNHDDESYKTITHYIDPAKKILTYSYRERKDYVSPLEGYYNNENTLAAATICEYFGLTRKQIADALKTFPGVKGRLEEVRKGQPFRVLVDFAHTPNALEKLLINLSTQKKSTSKLIVVFGSAGLRDKTKRPKMGKAVNQHADYAFITSEDPRTEDPLVIAHEIAQGFTHKQKFEIEVDRMSAIKKAMDMAKKDDIVVITGKGHEQSMCFGKKETHWSDQEAALQILKQMKYE
jgi:UDP-N-acetylmuramoyl-L-alanyl-D-glutamate--2,6-diaminopimelate ligase